MSDADNDSSGRYESAHSDFSRFAEERKRYAESMREARRLKSVGEEPGRSGEHPWLQASKKAKETGSPREDRSTGRAPAGSRLWLAGVAFCVCVGLAVYGAMRMVDTHGATAPADASQHLHVWHSLDGPELTQLHRFAAAFNRDEIDVVLTHHFDVERALRQSALLGDAPDVIITSESQARSLGELGVLETLEQSAEQQQFFLPLVEPQPWSTPLVAAIPVHPGPLQDLEIRREFLHYLQDQLHRGVEPSIPTAP